jgi:hypothetical protein
MEQVMVATLAASPASFGKIRLLVDSLRDFGGTFLKTALMVVHPDSLKVASEDARLWASRDVHMISFRISSEEMQFPLSSVATGAAAAEEAVAGKTETLVWLLEDTLVLRSPSAFALLPSKQYAYRPVHHTNIGSPWDAPPDGFWTAIYRHCKVEPDRLFPMNTCVRDNAIRPYFNAGCQVTRPQNGLFSHWRDVFRRLCHHPDFIPFLASSSYRVFMHQAVLAGVVLSSFSPEQLHELPESYNYPLHLHTEYPCEFRPIRLNDLVTCRYETIDELKKVLALVPVDEPVKTWMLSNI